MKKKILSVLLAACLLFGIFPLSASAAEGGSIPKSTCQWALSDDGTLTISGSGSLDVAFALQYDSATDTYSPNTPWYPYRDKVKRGVIEDGVDIYQSLYVFMDCENLVSVQLPATAREISAGFFQNCKSLQSVELPSTVNAIRYEAFSGCESLQSVTLSESLTEIDEWAFQKCTGLTSLTIPAGTEPLDLSAFRFCQNLRDIHFLGTEEQWAKVDASSLKKAVVHYDGEPTYTVTFDANGGSVSPAGKTVQRTKEYGGLPTPVKGSTKFLGWYTAKEGGERIDQYAIVDITADQTLYARWSEGSSALSPADGRRPAASSNVSANQYDWNWASTVQSYLYENDIGGLTRVEYTGEKVVVEEYDGEFKLQAYLSIQPELSVWGGFYSGETYNFLIYGQNNMEEVDSAEVVRVVKYDKAWNRLGHASLHGANTQMPFEAGSLRCAESGGYLFIHTCHQMFKSGDGLNHQANLTFSVRQSDMEIVDSRYTVSNIGMGYVSHSFNQFVLVNQNDNLVTVDHGDAYPRSIVLVNYSDPASRGKLGRPGSNYNILEFPGEIGANYTGAEVGGFTETAGGYLVAYRYNGGTSGADPHVYYQYVSKSSGTGTSVKLSQTAGATPQVVSTGLNGGYILWNGKDDRTTLYYAAYSDGGAVGEVKTASAPLSDCQPISVGDKVVWYVTNDSVPAFYILDSSGNLTKKVAGSQGGTGFTDVPADAYYASAVKWAVDSGITTGTSETKFSPDSTCTRAQAVTFLWRAAEKPEPISYANPFWDVPYDEYYTDAVSWAVENNVTNGVSDIRFDPTGYCTRAQIVTFLWRAAGKPEPAAVSNPFKDVNANDYYYKAVLWAVENGITNGTSADKFSPTASCTRAQIVTFLYRYSD